MDKQAAIDYLESLIGELKNEDVEVDHFDMKIDFGHEQKPNETLGSYKNIKDGNSYVSIKLKYTNKEIRKQFLNEME